MGEGQPPQIPILFEVRPTAAQVTEQHADIALTGLFNAHAGQISSERQTIWQRYTTMFIGNSIVMSVASGTGRSLFQTIAGALLGLILCALWFGMTVSGWRVFRMRVDRALGFSWTGFDPRANPFSVTIEYESGRFGGWLYWFALGVIGFFGLFYLVILVSSIW